MPFSICAFVLLEFTRSPHTLRDTVLQSPVLERIRHSVESETGAKLLVLPVLVGMD